jgi:hypothetical protein
VGMVLALGLGIMFMLFWHSRMPSKLRKYYGTSAPNLLSPHYDQSTATPPHDLWAQVSGSETAILRSSCRTLLHVAFERRIEFPFFWRSIWHRAKFFRPSRNRTWGGSWCRGDGFREEGRNETSRGPPRLGLLGSSSSCMSCRYT